MPVPKPARLEARLTQKHQAIIQHAAALRGQSVTDFVVAASLDAAEKAIAQSELITLSLADQKRFAKALLGSKPPTKAMKRAFASHRQLVEP